MSNFIEIPGVAKINTKEISMILAVESGGGSPYRTVAQISMKNGDKVNVLYNTGWTYERLCNEWSTTDIVSPALKEFMEEQSEID